ncbi:MAG TPA: hypothetical protein VLX32_00370 [Candidatus Acidoferrum sp.]|nr:hypothetical protein [Candidatus Acidoferrum sp.]
MLCENYRQPLRDVAARGDSVSQELRSHLDACEECRAALTREQFLFAEMDAGLRAIANPHVPVSFSPRVCAELARQPVPSRRFPAAWVWVPTIAVASLAVAISLPSLINDLRSGDSPVVVVKPVPSAGAVEKIQPATHPTRSTSIHVARLKSASSARVFARAAQPKVLVPPGQEIALAHYIALLQRRPVLAQAIGEDRNQIPLKIVPLEIAELSSQPLAIEPLAPEVGGTTR